MLPGTLAATHSIRDTNQVKYIQQKFRNQVKLTKNYIVSVIAVQNETGNFVRDHQIKPLHVSMMTDDMRNEVNKILENMPVQQPLEYYMDTQFGVGDFFATQAGVKHPMFERRVMSTN